jgi:hypothetical protein
MADFLRQQKFPEKSTNRDYDIFEVMSDGSTVWRACVFGMDNIESKLRDLRRQSNNEFFVIDLHDQTRLMICPLKSTSKDLRRAG